MEQLMQEQLMQEQQMQPTPDMQLNMSKEQQKYLKLANKIKESEQALKVAQAQYESDVYAFQSEAGQSQI